MKVKSFALDLDNPSTESHYILDGFWFSTRDPKKSFLYIVPFEKGRQLVALGLLSKVAFNKHEKEVEHWIKRREEIAKNDKSLTSS